MGQWKMPHIYEFEFIYILYIQNLCIENTQ